MSASLGSNRMVASIGCLGCQGLRSNRMVASIGCQGCQGLWVRSPSSLYPLLPSIHFLEKITSSIPILVLYFQQNKKVVRGADREDREDKIRVFEQVVDIISEKGSSILSMSSP